MRIKWLHLSDIHFNYKNFDSEVLRGEFIRRIAALSNRERFTHLILSGDLLFGNQDEKERSIATISFIRRLAEAMAIVKEKVIIVPGNHDHDRSCASEIIGDLSESIKGKVSVGEETEKLAGSNIDELLNAFEHFNDIYKEIFQNDYYLAADNPHILFIDNEVAFLKLNTAWLEYKSGEAVYIGRMQLLELLQAHKSELEGKIIIAVGHHPLEDFAEEDRFRLLKLFSTFNISLYLCGHQHQATTRYFNEHDVLQIVCPGGYLDGYSTGGYITGLIDTDCDLYKAEAYVFNDTDWRIYSEFNQSDEHGIYWITTKRFRNASGIAVAAFNLLDGNGSRNDFEDALGTDNFEMIPLTPAVVHQENVDWITQQRFVDDVVGKIRTKITEGKVVHIFPIAPIPTLMYLGFKLQHADKIVIHQLDRQKSRWVYNEEIEDAEPEIRHSICNRSKLAILLSTSAPVEMKLVSNALSCDISDYDTIEIKLNNYEIGHPLYITGVNKVVKTLFEKIDSLATSYESIHFFSAVPAGLALEIGRNLLRSIYCNVFTYNLSGGDYHEAIIINRNEPVKKDDDAKSDEMVYIERYNLSVTMLPVLGKVACGELAEAILESDEYIPVPTEMIGSGEYFVLIAHGDSMINAGIADGNYVVIRRQQVADDGKIVVSIVDGETNLKRLRHDVKNQKIILHPENEMYPDQVYDDLEIQGVAVMIIKRI